MTDIPDDVMRVARNLYCTWDLTPGMIARAIMAEREKGHDELEKWKKRTWVTERELVKRREDVLSLAEKLGVHEDDFETMDEIVAAAIRKGEPT